ncbi:MAG: CU044_2847 family protein [Gammaproteobacteria bacterium]
MSELGIIELEGGQRLFIEVEALPDEEQRRLAASIPQGTRGHPADLPPGAEPTGVREEIIDALGQMRENIRTLAGEVHQALQEHKPQEWSLEFSIGFKGKANPIPFIVQGEAHAALKVTATWKE